jgi:hypothetical protein
MMGISVLQLRKEAADPARMHGRPRRQVDRDRASW